MRKESRIKGGFAVGVHRLGIPVMHAVRRHEADAAMAMLVVVPGKEGLTVRACILNAAKALGEVGTSNCK